jgi:hypothetical protein
MRLGTFLERADNTARLVDVKFHAVESDFFGTASEQDQEYDFYHWSAILRSVSGFEIYRKVYRDVIKPERVAELLILRPDMPRSLHASLNEVVSNLRLVASDEDSDTLRRAGRLRADLQFGRIDEILATGLHAFLTQFLDRVNELGGRISRDFLQARWQGGVHRRRAAVRGGQRQRAPQEEQLGGGHRHGHPPGVLAAGAPRLPAFRPAHRRLRRLQDAAPARGRTGGRQAARARRQPLAPGQGARRNPAAPDRRADLGLPLPRASVGALRAQERRGAGGLSRAQEPLRGRHPRMPGAAASRRRHADAAARADLQPGRARDLPADRTGRR